MPVRRRGRRQATPHHGKGRACGNKVRYETQEDARNSIFARVRKQGVSPDAWQAYPCPHGDHWHAGHRSGSQKRY